MSIKFSIIGAGKVGSALAIALYEIGLSPHLIIDKNKKKADILCKSLGIGKSATKIDRDMITRSKLIIISVRDDNIDEVIKSLIKQSNRSQINNYIIHTSGNKPAKILFMPGIKKSMIGVFHPVQTFNKIRYDSSKVRNIYYGISGGNAALILMKNICRKLDSKHLLIKDIQMSTYHLLCVVASNFICSNYIVIDDIIDKSGLNKTFMKKAMAMLSESTLDNIYNYGIKESITGPVARKDLSTIKNHINIIKKKFPDYLRYYKLNSSLINNFLKNSKTELNNILK